MASHTPTTTEAFQIILDSDYYWSRTGLDKQIRRNYRFQVSTGKGLTIDKQEEMLVKAGFTVEHEKTWRMPD